MVIFNVDINIFIKQHDELLLVALLSSHVQGRASGCNQIEIDAWLGEDSLDIVGIFKIHGELNRKPAITRAFIHIYLHIKQFDKDFASFAEDSIVESAPTFFSQFVDDEWLKLLHFN